jgi:hypothetical protein
MLLAIALGLTSAQVKSKPQATTPEVFASLRVRSESWGWFKPSTPGYQSSYTFSHNLLRFGARLPTAHRVSGLRPFETVIEAAAPLLLGLPHNAVAPSPIGSLGTGAQYRQFNGSQQGSLFIKTAFIHMPQAGRNPDILIGRFETVDGIELLPGDSDLAYIQTQRAAARLFTPNPFTAIGRSFDGVKVSRTLGTHNITAMAFYPTTGQFNLDGGDTITKVRQVYLADSRATKSSSNRVFAALYTDARGLNAVDNDLTPTNAAINVTTIGGNAQTSSMRGKWRTDTLLWGAVQGGQWGSRPHQAYAGVAEAGIKHPSFGGWWLRGGSAVFSGDTSPNDQKHETFAPQITAPRQNWRTPTVTEANLNEVYIMAIKRNKKETIRLEAHQYALDKVADRWYSGGPVFQTTGSFALSGRPSNGYRDLGTMVDASYDVTLNPRDTVSLYIGYVRGGEIVASSNTGRSAFLGFAQITRKF